MNPDQNVHLRIIDANLNRAREALRVMEEFARLALDDALLSGAIKEIRHGLAEAVAGLEDRCDSPKGFLIAARDIVGDVGTEVATDAEYQRRDEAHVATAAGKRLSEAMRVIEEYGKTLDAGFAVALEKLRYRGYEIERRIALTVRAIERFGQVRLYVIITEAYCAGDWFAAAGAALRGGADCLQLREKDLPDRELLDRAKRLADLCREHDALFILNDRPDLAEACGASGVHLGLDDMPVSAARRILPVSAIIGVSTHTVDEAVTAASGAPDYLAVGPMFETQTKPLLHIAGPAMLAEVRKRTALPLVAIGGITSENVGQVLPVSPCAVCACQSVISQGDVEASTRRLRDVIDHATQNVVV